MKTPLEQTLLRACKLALKHTSRSDDIPSHVDGALTNAIRLAEQDSEPKAPAVECWNCGGNELRCETEDIPDLHQRMEAGGEVPAGECAKCGCLSYLVKGAK